MDIHQRAGCLQGRDAAAPFVEAARYVAEFDASPTSDHAGAGQPLREAVFAGERDGSLGNGGRRARIAANRMGAGEEGERIADGVRVVQLFRMRDRCAPMRQPRPDLAEQDRGQRQIGESRRLQILQEDPGECAVALDVLERERLAQLIAGGGELADEEQGHAKRAVTHQAGGAVLLSAGTL